MVEIETCNHCGFCHSGICYRIKSIEYWQDGRIKKVEYHDTNSNLFNINNVTIGPGLNPEPIKPNLFKPISNFATSEEITNFCKPGKHLGIGLGHDICEVCGKNTYS